jgi:hypothetical protein
MSIRKSRKRDAIPLPALLERVIHAINQTPDDSSDRSGHSAALTELAQWAWTRVLSEGVLLPANDRDYRIIQDVAMRHLGLREARAEFNGAVAAVEPVEKRDAVESACDHQQAVSEAGYYYAGLACGIALTHLTAR